MHDAERQLSVRREGDGDEVVVLLHGLVGSSRYWTTLLPHVRGPFRFVCPDLLGFGRSPWPEVDYTVDTHLAALDRDVFSRERGRLHLVGHSLGALLAHEWAARNLDRVRSLVLLGLPYFDTEGEARQTLAASSAWVCLDVRARPLAWLACQCICQRRRLWGPLLPYLFPGLPAEAVQDVLLHTFHSFDTTLRATLFAHRPEPAAELLSAADVRVRLVGHEQDRFAPAERLRRYADRHPNAELTLLDTPGDGHLISLHAPDRTGELLTGWISGPGARSRPGT